MINESPCVSTSPVCYPSNHDDIFWKSLSGMANIQVG